MASVFLSYDREDVTKARVIAQALERAGHSVWWDRHIRSGAQYSKEIEDALKRADAVVVLWSKHSVESPWVRDEAAAGRDKGQLIPVLLELVSPPMGFRQYQNLDFSSWKGRGKPPQLRTLLADIDSKSGSATETRITKPTDLKGDARRLLRRGQWVLIAVAGLVLVALAALAWNLVDRRSTTPVVAVAAADSSPASETLAGDLLVMLGSLRSAKADSVRLISAAAIGEAPEADLIFQAMAATDAGGLRGNLALIAGKDRSILWSKDFVAQGGVRALGQSIAYTAGHILDCALEAVETGQERVSQDTLKLFLNGCALFADKYRADPQGVGPIFSRIVERAPRFQPAWRKLLLSEALFTRTERLVGRYSPGELPKHIAAARKLNREIPEIYVAESTLLPTTAYARRSELLERAVRLDPQNPDLLLMRAELNLFVGRMAAVIEDAARAVELNPLSPGLRSHLVADLAYAGRLDSAREELRRAEQLWPASAALEDARLRLSLRYGDPKEALRMLRSGPVGRQPIVSRTVEITLAARIDPTESNIRRAIAAARSRAATDTVSLADLIQMMGEFHREDELFQLLLNWPRNDMLSAIGEVLFRPTLERFRHDPRFMRVADRVALIDYWRQSGKWPDFCFEPDLPYDCKAEAAKLAGSA